MTSEWYVWLPQLIIGIGFLLIGLLLGNAINSPKRVRHWIALLVIGASIGGMIVGYMMPLHYRYGYRSQGGFVHPYYKGNRPELEINFSISFTMEVPVGGNTLWDEHRDESTTIGNRWYHAEGIVWWKFYDELSELIRVDIHNARVTNPPIIPEWDVRDMISNFEWNATRLTPTSFTYWFHLEWLPMEVEKDEVE